MDIRFRGLNGALIRQFTRKAGGRENERIVIERLMQLFVDGTIDPLSGTTRRARSPHAAVRPAPRR